MPLNRILRLRDVLLLIVGVVIGSGIFLVPAAVLRDVGGRLDIALLAWCTGGVLTLLGALTFAELGAQNPRAGGLYVYLRDCFGRLPAFLYGWALFFVICSGSVAALTVAFSHYLGQIVPLSPLEAKAVSIAVIVVIAAINVRGTRLSSDLLNWSTAIKLAVLLGMAVALLALGRHSKDALAMTSTTGALPSGSLLSGFGLAMVSILWAYEGWPYATFSAGETLHPQKTIPRSFLLATVVLIAVYILANLGYVAALGRTTIGDDSIAATALGSVLGGSAAKLISLAIMISTFSAANSLFLTSSRVYYAMAQDRLFFKRLAEIHPRFGTPAFSVVAGAIWSIALAASGSFEQLLTYVVFSGWIFYGLGAGAIFVYRRRTPASARPYSVPGYPWSPILFIAAAGAIVVNTIVAQPQRAAVGIGIVLIGAPAFFLWSRHTQAEVVQPGYSGQGDTIESVAELPTEGEPLS